MPAVSHKKNSVLYRGRGRGGGGGLSLLLPVHVTPGSFPFL